MENYFRIEDLDIYYGGIRVIKNLSLNVEEGETVSILGPNGAGKSTLLKSIINVGSANIDGEIFFKGENLADLSTSQISKKSVSLAGERGNHFPSMSVKDNLLMAGYLLEEGLRERLEVCYELFPILEERKNQKSDQLSGGERKMLALAMALMTNPELILIDEPSLGLAVGVRKKLESRIKSMKERGHTILAAEQNVGFMKEIADRFYLLDESGNLSEEVGTDVLEERAESIYF